MAVERRTTAATNLTTEFWRWRNALDYRTCPSLLEAFAAGVEAADQLRPPLMVTVTRTVTVAAPPPPLTRDEALTVLRVFELDAATVHSLSEREAQLLALIAAEPHLNLRELGLRVWGQNSCWFAQVRAVVGRIRAKLKKARSSFCVGRVRFSRYRLHRIGDGELCPPYPGGAHGHTYQPACRAASSAARSDTGVVA